MYCNGIVFLGLFLFISESFGNDQTCNVSVTDLEKLQNMINNIQQTIYKKVTVDSSDQQCRTQLKKIHQTIRKLSQKYKLMATNYHTMEEFEKLKSNFTNELDKMIKEFETLKKSLSEKNDAAIRNFELQTTALKEQKQKLEERLREAESDYQKVKKDLCEHYLEADQLQNAKNQLNDMDSKYVILVIQKLMNKTDNSMTMIEFSSSVPDLDDRVKTLRMIVDYLRKENHLLKAVPVVLRSEIFHLINSLNDNSNITDDSREELVKMESELTQYGQKTLENWEKELSNEATQTEIKYALERMAPQQMENFASMICKLKDFKKQRLFVNILAVVNNDNKIKAFTELLQNGMNYSKVTIAFMVQDMINANSQDKLNKSWIEKAQASIPAGVKLILSCSQKLYTITHMPEDCICLQNQVEQAKNQNPKFSNTLGSFKYVTTTKKAEDCTKFRITPCATHNGYFKIESQQANALQVLNFHLPSDTYMGYVATNYKNLPNSFLDISDKWILVPTGNESLFHIQTDFKKYTTINETIDYLVVRNVDDKPRLFVRRYGEKGLETLDEKEKSNWNIKCASE